MRKLLMIFYVLIIVLSCNQHYQYRSIDEVLEKKEIGREFLSLADTVAETKAIYLGQVTKKDGQLIKVVNVISLVGKFEGSKKASCKITLFDSSNHFIGSYYVGAKWDLPSKIENGSLIFEPSADCKTSDRIDLKDSIPRLLFVKCNGKQGNLYELSTDEEN